MNSKILTLDQLGTESGRLREEGKRVVVSNGCFDILHVGHVRYLAAARKLGDVLVVGLNGDDSVRQLKGGGRPVNRERDRAEVLTALESVETVHYALRWDGEWHLDFASLETALDAAPRTRAILVVSPGNPTGAYLKQAEREALAQLGCPLICDEVFADYPAFPDPRRARTAAAWDEVLSFALSGLSKVMPLLSSQMNR